MSGSAIGNVGGSFTDTCIVIQSDARTGDYLEFYAETALYVAISLCPAEAGSDDLRESWSEDANGAIAVNPVA